MNTAVEADDGNTVLRARARKPLQSWIVRLSCITSEGIKKRQIDPQVDPRRLSQLIIGSLEGALLISRLQNDDEPLRGIRQHLEEHLEHNIRAKSARPNRARPS